jgi:hypothetical protein
MVERGGGDQAGTKAAVLASRPAGVAAGDACGDPLTLEGERCKWWARTDRPTVRVLLSPFSFTGDGILRDLLI